jgi:hypothetical protein
MTPRAFLVMGPSEARSDFERFAKEGGFTVSRSSITPLSAEVTNAAEVLNLVFSKEGAAIFIALAAVIRGYLKYKASCRVTVTLFKDGGIKSVDARGYSEPELVKILPEVREILVYTDPIKNDHDT